MENLYFPYGRVKFCLREGDCVLRGQPMGTPSRPRPPLPMCENKASYTTDERSQYQSTPSFDNICDLEITQFHLACFFGEAPSV